MGEGKFVALDKNIVSVLECAWLVSAGDSEITEEEEDSVIHHVGILRRIFEARKAIELYEKNGDIAEARKLFDPETPIVINEHEILFGIPREMNGLVQKRREVSSTEALIALEKSTARKIKDPFVQKIALIVSEAIASADGEFAGTEQTSWVNMADIWGLEYGEVHDWYGNYAQPILNGEEPDDEDSDDFDGDLEQELRAALSCALGLSDEDENEEEDLPEIFEIARSGGIQKFRTAWKRLSPLDPNAEHDGISLVGWALRGEQTKIAKFLFDNGASVNHRSSSGETPLIVAIALQNDEAVDLCLKAGADPEFPSHQDAVNHAGKPTKRNVTPLAHAAQRDNSEFVMVLIEAGAAVDFRMDSGHTALMTAATADATSAASALLAAGANPDLDPPKKLKFSNWTPSTPLTCAAREDSGDVAKLFLERKVRVNLADGEGNTPLKWFARHGNDELVEALLAAGADPELLDTEGWGPLVSAAYREHASTVQLLLAAEAKPDTQTTDDDQYTPLIAAAEFGQADIVEALLKAGADVGLKNSAGKTALDVALEAAADEDNADQLESFNTTIQLLGGKQVSPRT